MENSTLIVNLGGVNVDVCKITNMEFINFIKAYQFKNQKNILNGPNISNFPPKPSIIQNTIPISKKPVPLSIIEKNPILQKKYNEIIEKLNQC